MSLCMLPTFHLGTQFCIIGKLGGITLGLLNSRLKTAGASIVPRSNPPDHSFPTPPKICLFLLQVCPFFSPKPVPALCPAPNTLILFNLYSENHLNDHKLTSNSSSYSAKEKTFQQICRKLTFHKSVILPDPLFKFPVTI